MTKRPLMRVTVSALADQYTIECDQASVQKDGSLYLIRWGAGDEPNTNVVAFAAGQWTMFVSADAAP